ERFPILMRFGCLPGALARSSILTKTLQESGVNAAEGQFPGTRSTAGVKIVIDRLCRGRVDSGNRLKVGQGGALDCHQGAEMAQERTLASRADAGNFLQATAADIALTPRSVRADCEAMRFVAQTLNEIEHGV